MDLYEARLARREAELDELDAEIKTLEFKAPNVPTDRQLRLHEDLQALRAQHAKTQEKLGELRQAGRHEDRQLEEQWETAWKDLQNGMERAQRSLK